jgi:ribosomal protein L12E/L44/L45/RPP1/RPP2
MAYSPELLQRLIDAGRRYKRSTRLRGRLPRYREALLIQRAQGMTYDEISRLLTSSGVAISPGAVGTFCRRAFTQDDLDRARRQLTEAPAGTAAAPSPQTVAPAPVAPAPAAATLPQPGRRGPRIARDVY